MTPFAIAGIQTHISAIGSNVDHLKSRIDIAMRRFGWIDMILLSELAPFGPLIEKHPDDITPTLEAFCEIARNWQIWLVPGSIFERRGDKVFNTTVVINPSGEIIGRYDKLFPFLPYEVGVEGGSRFLTFDVPNVGRFGLSICYDLWFPETSRTLTSLGAEVILHPVLTGTTDRDVELAMARATAAQFQCFVIDVNGLGAGGLGRSCIVGPGGDLLYECRAEEEIFPIEIDIDQVRHQREFGQNGLGQVLKSFRDRNIEFDVYNRANADFNGLDALGPLTLRSKRPAQY